MIFFPGLDVNVLLAGCVESGGTCTMCVCDHCTPVNTTPGDVKLRSRLHISVFIGLARAGYVNRWGVGRIQGVGLRRCDTVFLGGK